MSKAPTARQLGNVFAPPVMAARAWAAAAEPDPRRPLLNLSQAAPVDPPPVALRAEMARLVMDDPGAHVYGPVLGLPGLRDEVAARWSAIYGGEIDGADVAITSGCNQAFAAAISSVADAGDNVILPTPWYFNHRMWLGMAGIETRLLRCAGDMVPDPAAAARLIDARTRAIVLVTPNNPTGAEYPEDVLEAFASLARERGLALIVDETYRDFLSHDARPHGLFAGEWRDVLIHLYSFSKVYRLTGHRVGALIADRARLAQIEKFLDTVTICPNQLGQRAALFGLQNLGEWVAGERDEIRARTAILRSRLPALEGWKLMGLGAYFAYLEHPHDLPSDVLAERLVHEAGLLLLPGTMFAPPLSEGGDGDAERQIRIAFANADAHGLATLIDRLSSFSP